MRLLLDCVHLGRGPLVRVGADAGDWRIAWHPHPRAYLAAVAGTVPAGGSILLDDRDVSGLPAHERARAGLATVSGVIPDLRPLRVVDVLSLGRPLPTGTGLWQVAMGIRRARAAVAEAEAAVRNLAGRLGLAEWLPHPVGTLPEGVASLVDLARALAALPRAVVWRRPDWLPGETADHLAELLHEEQRRLDVAVVEVRVSQGERHGAT